MAFAKIKPVPSEYASNAVIYARYSSDKQTENSIDGQLRLCREYCTQKGFKVVEEYIDRAMSGTDDNRPDFQRMIRDAEKQKFAFVIVYRFDRFMRNRYDSAIYKKRLEQVGVRVLSASEQISDGDEGIILESIYEAMDEAYSRRLSRITKRGMREAASKGLWTGGNVPYGYRVEEQKLVIDEREARAIRCIFEMYSSGKTKTQIANHLNGEGFRTKTGKLWSSNNLTVPLSNTVYYGDYTYIDNEQGNIPRTCPAIIDKELFDKAQKYVEEGKRVFGRKTVDTFDFALSGKLFCGYCGAAMVGDSGTSRSGEKHYYYSCGKKKKRLNNCKKKSERKNFLEWYICEQTVQCVLTEEGINEISRRVVEEAKKDIDVARMAELESELKKIEKDIDSSVNALMNTTSKMVIDKLNEKFDILEKQKNSLTEELSEIKFREQLIVTEKEVQAFLRSFLKGDLLDKEFRRHLIGTLINCVYVWDDKISIYYNVKGAKQINHLDVIDYLDELSECSDSMYNGEPKNSVHASVRNFYLLPLHSSLFTKLACTEF